ncbi:hypothetical protein VE03_06830 [Pseudogymnoascus sp. 23342-1-I1]|nr:hypothetical protein VE03_06830 [Pseudogymnoascus sp. 23342-1-I1]
MTEREELLSLDLEESDYLYRIRRGKRVIYVSVLDTYIVPPNDRTEGSRILSHLRRLPGWDGGWRTLTARRKDGAVECTVDEFMPHRLDGRSVAACVGRRFDVVELERRGRISERVARVVVEGVVCVAKIARFRHELEALEREVRVYGALRDRGFGLAPGFVGYVYEEEEERVIGFLMEELQGRHPGVGDLRACGEAVEKLHGVGVVHGDLNRYNIIIRGNVAKLIDFEVVTFLEDGHHVEAKDELRKLAEELLDTSEGFQNHEPCELNTVELANPSVCNKLSHQGPAEGLYEAEPTGFHLLFCMKLSMGIQGAKGTSIRHAMHISPSTQW